MYLELRLGGFAHDEIEDMTLDQLVLFYRFLRARFLETVSYLTLAFHSKPRRFYNELMRNIRTLELGRKEVPYYDRARFKEYVKRLAGVVVEEQGGDSGSRS